MKVYGLFLFLSITLLAADKEQPLNFPSQQACGNLLEEHGSLIVELSSRVERVERLLSSLSINSVSVYSELLSTADPIDIEMLLDKAEGSTREKLTQYLMPQKSPRSAFDKPWLTRTMRLLESLSEDQYEKILSGFSSEGVLALALQIQPEEGRKLGLYLHRRTTPKERKALLLKSMHLKGVGHVLSRVVTGELHEEVALAIHKKQHEYEQFNYWFYHYREFLMAHRVEEHFDFDHKKPQVFVDLGSGFGEVAYYLALKYPHLTVVGYEAVLEKYRLAQRIANEFLELPNLRFYHQDLCKPFQLIRADFYYSYGLSTPVVNALRDPLESLASQHHYQIWFPRMDTSSYSNFLEIRGNRRVSKCTFK